jgi:diguanylate cyclase (GGDEF)-like protein/PAS domain S-box-containing protein
MALSLKAKTNLAMFLALAILATMSWFSFRESRRLADKDRWVSHTRDVLDLSERLRAHSADAGTSRRAYVLLGDVNQLPLFESASSSTRADLVGLRQAVQDNPPQVVRVTALEQLIRARLSILKSSVNLHETTAKDRQGQDGFTEQTAKVSIQVTDQLRQFENVERDLLQKRIREAEASDRRATAINGFLGMSVFLSLIVAVGILNRELSRRSQAEMAVGKQRQFLESILNSCSDVVVVADEAGRIILRNPAADRLYNGVSAQFLSDEYPQLLGIWKEDRVTPFAAQDLPLVRTVRGESVDAVEMYVQSTGQAEGRYFLAAGRPLLDSEGHRRGGVIFLRDVTERKRDTERLNAALLVSERIARERSELNRLGDLFQSCHDIAEACKVVEALSASLFDSRPGRLCLTNSSRNLLESSASWGDCSSTKEIFDPSDCWGLRLGKLYAGGNEATSLRCAHVIDEPEAGYLCVPLMAQGETYGVLYVEEKSAPTGSSIEAIANQRNSLEHLALAAAERISLAVANLTLREVLRSQSIRDPLTGLFNRRYLEESLERELHRAGRTQGCVSMVMLDLDHFKEFNDTFGHQAGDLLLREVGAVIKARVRAGDLACRYGGEEFALILAEANQDGAQACVNTLRAAVKQLSVQFRGQSLGSVTLSAGIATFPGHGNNSEDLIHMADRALYSAKKAGRDCVVVCEEHESISS